MDAPEHGWRLPAGYDAEGTGMKPYFQDDQVQLYLGDMREVLPALVSEGLQADCMIADVPYGETSLPWDRWPDGWLDVAAGASRSLWCFGSMRMFLEHAGEFKAARWKLSQDVIWEKHNGSGFAADRFRRVHESAVHWYRGEWGGIRHEVPRVPADGPRVSGRQAEGSDSGRHLGAFRRRPYQDDGTRLLRSVIRVRSMQGRAIHRTEKPTALLMPLIEYACRPGGLVVAPFAGSGSDLEAARNLGCRAIGIEIDGEACEKAARRLSQATLFGDGAA